MIFDFIKKCNFDQNSSIIEADLDLLELDNKFKLDTDNLDDYCIRYNISNINLICSSLKHFKLILLDNNITILNKTEYLYIKYEKYTDDQFIIEHITILLRDMGWDIVYECTNDEEILFENKAYRASLISESGAWNIKNVNEHIFDEKLADGILNYFNENNIKTCVDFGCGEGKYVDFFNSNGIITKGFDGNKFTPELTNNTCKILDLSKQFDLNEKFDCVMTLEVGEHIPEKYEKTFIENIIRHTNNLVILSWAIPDQGGYGHVNCKSNRYIKNIFLSAGFKNNKDIEKKLRENVNCSWFENTIMVFNKE